MRHPDFPVPPRIDAFASWEASLRLAFARRGGRTVLASCRHRGPLRVQKALYPEGEGVCHVVLLHPPRASPAATCSTSASSWVPRRMRC